VPFQKHSTIRRFSAASKAAFLTNSTLPEQIMPFDARAGGAVMACPALQPAGESDRKEGRLLARHAPVWQSRSGDDFAIPGQVLYRQN
jgi:hypothetical protein